MNTGDLVRFKNPHASETGLIMRIIWIDNPRMMVEYINTDLIIQPTQILNIDDVELL
jgi:hypothetical protein